MLTIIIISIYIISTMIVWINTHEFYKDQENIRPVFGDVAATFFPIFNTFIAVIIVFFIIADYFKEMSYEKLFGLKNRKK